MRRPDHRDGVELELLRREQAAMPGDDVAVIVDQDRIHPSELDD
jgi:hypothetical protein